MRVLTASSDVAQLVQKRAVVMQMCIRDRVRVAPIAQYSPLLPPVGVWAVSQSQCGRDVYKRQLPS